jgi:CubicO group peptidase (beta-lactamase class C family)
MELIALRDGSDMSGPVAEGASEFAAKLASFVKDNRLAGTVAAVVHGDEMAWSGAAGFADIAAKRPARPDTLYRIASITKTFTGTAIMRLRDEGKLDLDDPAVQWLPELAGAGTPREIGRVTIRRLLSHESGLMGDPPGTEWAGTGPHYDGVVSRNLARAAEIVTAIGPNLQPKYSNLGYQLLGEIVARASGQDYPAYVREHILGPLGQADTSFEPLTEALMARCATGYTGRAYTDELDVAPTLTGIGAEGGLWSSAEDLARWLSLQLSAHGDAPRQSAVLSADSLREMHKPRYLSDETWTSAWGISWYAVRKDEVAWVQHSGGLHGFTSNACFDRDSGVGAIVLVNGIADAPALAMELGAMARRLANAAAPALPVRPPTPEQYRALLGPYLYPGSAELCRIEWRDRKLVLISPATADPIELKPAGEPDSYIVGPGFRDSGERVCFSRAADGRVASVLIGSGTLLRLDPVDAG